MEVDPAVLCKDPHDYRYLKSGRLRAEMGRSADFHRAATNAQTHSQTVIASFCGLTSTPVHFGSFLQFEILYSLIHRFQFCNSRFSMRWFTSPHFGSIDFVILASPGPQKYFRNITSYSLHIGAWYLTLWRRKALTRVLERLLPYIWWPNFLRFTIALCLHCSLHCPLAILNPKLTSHSARYAVGSIEFIILNLLTYNKIHPPPNYHRASKPQWTLVHQDWDTSGTRASPVR